MPMSSASFPPPPAGTLLVDAAQAAKLRRAAVDFPSASLDAEALLDLELLLDGWFSPLSGYLSQADHASVLSDMRLASGEFWPLPITLPVAPELARTLSPGGHLALRDQEGFMLAVLGVEEIFEADPVRESMALFGHADPDRHPGAARLLARQGLFHAAGRVLGLHVPQHSDFLSLRRRPEILRRVFAKRGWRRIIGFPTTAPLHRMHREVLLSEALRADAGLLVSPVFNPRGLVDVRHFTLVRCLRRFLEHLPHSLALLSIMPWRQSDAGPRGALLQALALANAGCTHFLVEPGEAAGRDPGPDAVLAALREHREDLGIIPLRFRPRVYVKRYHLFVAPEDAAPDMVGETTSHARICSRLEMGQEMPAWASFPEVIEELRRAIPPRDRQGFTLFFTGLSGAGKSTLAKMLYVKLLEAQDRPVTLLDGDIVRRHLSRELGFSREHRHINVTRIGFVASEITKNRGIAICAPIAPYAASRAEVREMVAEHGGFFEIHVSTPLSVCEGRDRKGLYARARAGLITGVTGVDDPYEPPVAPELAIDTTDIAPEEAVRTILDHLRDQGYLPRS